MHFKFDLFEEERIVSEKEGLVQVDSVCVCERERGQGSIRREREERKQHTQRFSTWPMNEQLEVGGRETWTLGSCPIASLLGNRLLH